MSNSLLVAQDTVKAQIQARLGRPQEQALYTATDMYAVVTPSYPEDRLVIPKPVVLTSLVGISRSVHRDIFPVRQLSTYSPVGFAYGNRTVAGSFIFAQLGEYGAREIVADAFTTTSTTPQTADFRGVLSSPAYNVLGVDEIPPINVTIVFANDAGGDSFLQLLGVKMLDEGESWTVDDQEWCSTVSYMALSCTPVRPLIRSTARLPSQAPSVALPVKRSGSVQNTNTTPLLWVGP